ncbi:MAG: MFS transporter, partial [Ignavibacteriales bacterium]|nr:MFS transporter [Ignavibacteriales bacterium]
MKSSKFTNSYASLRIKEYRRFLSFRFLLTFAVQMQSLVVGWQIYQISKDPLSLGMIGLAEAIPFFCVALFAGHVADSFNRRTIIILSGLTYIFCAIGLTVITHFQDAHAVTNTLPIYFVILVTGFARGFMWPALNAFGAQLIPRELFGNAATVTSLTWQVAAVGGPAVGGIVCGYFGMFNAYLFVLVISVIGVVTFLGVSAKPMTEKPEGESIRESLFAGVKFVFSNQLILSAISLDMFAVFFGGAICILPMFADQILHIDAKGLG